MAGIEMRFNGRKIVSASRLRRELARSLEKVEKHVEDSLNTAAGPGARMNVTPLFADRTQGAVVA